MVERARAQADKEEAAKREPKLSPKAPEREKPPTDGKAKGHGLDAAWAQDAHPRGSPTPEAEAQLGKTRGSGSASDNLVAAINDEGVPGTRAMVLGRAHLCM